MAKQMDEKQVRALVAGDVVSWTSQASGSSTEKVGRVVCQVPKRTSVEEAAKQHLHEWDSKAGQKCDNISLAADRVLVLVQRRGKRGVTGGWDYYAPPVSRLVRRGLKLSLAELPVQAGLL